MTKARKSGSEMTVMSDTIWEAYTRTVDWEGFTKEYRSLSIHRTKEGAEKAVEEFNGRHPTLATSNNFRIGVLPRTLED